MNGPSAPHTDRSNLERRHGLPRRPDGLLEVGVMAAGPKLAPIFTWVAAVLAAAASGGTLWFTYEGLKVGFL